MNNKTIFNKGDLVRAIKDIHNNGWYVGVEGIIQEVRVDRNNNTIYGVELTEGNKNISKEEFYEITDLIYFLAIELELK